MEVIATEAGPMLRIVLVEAIPTPAGEVCEVRLRRPWAEDLAAVEHRGPRSRAIVLLERLSGLPMRSLIEMSVDDFGRCQRAVDDLVERHGRWEPSDAENCEVERADLFARRHYP